MLRTSVFLMTMMVMGASASAQDVEVSATVGYTFSEGVSGNAVLVPGVGTFDRIEPKDAFSWGLRFGFFAGDNSEIGFLYNQQAEILKSAARRRSSSENSNCTTTTATTPSTSEAPRPPRGLYVLFGLEARSTARSPLRRRTCSRTLQAIRGSPGPLRLA